MAWGRDPFSPSKAGLEYQRSDLELKGISVGKDKAGFAFINNEIVKTGDKIGGYEVGEVEKNRVLLKKAGRAFTWPCPKSRKNQGSIVNGLWSIEKYRLNYRLSTF